MKETQETIVAWANATFGPAPHVPPIAARANQEMAELLRAATVAPLDLGDRAKVIEEAADVVIILYRLAEVCGFDLHQAIDDKMEVNRRREWKLDGTGHGYHVRDKAVQP